MTKKNHSKLGDKKALRCSSSVRNRASVGGSGCGGESKEIGSARSLNVGP